MTSEKTLPAPGSRELRPDHELDRRYGAIGISAVAAAVRYHSGGKRDADRQSGTKDERLQQHGRAA